MKINTGVNDRFLRVFIGLLILGAGISMDAYWALIGVWFIISGVTGVSILYKLLNIRTDDHINQKNI